PSRLLRFNPALRGFWPWQRAQWAWKIGTTSVSNRGPGVAGATGFFGRPPSGAGGAAAHTNPKPAQTMQADPARPSHRGLLGVVTIAPLPSSRKDRWQEPGG